MSMEDLKEGQYLSVLFVIMEKTSWIGVRI